MKKLIRSFTSFSRTERIGLAGLSVLLVILIAVRATMYLWVHPDTEMNKNSKLIAAWENFKRTQPVSKATDTVEKIKNDYQDNFDDEAPLPAVVNINAADSATLVRFKGIGPVTAGKILSRIKNKGPFTDINQLSEVGSFSQVTLDVLKKHIVFK
jgi:DNA uptake protein ComE-like DNA-binding protein